jgi:S1-C subfamily serine protease
LTLPRALPFQGEIPPEFSAPAAYLGVRFEPVNADLAEAENLDVTEGAIIREVAADSPAAQAGLKVGDVVTAIGDQPVNAENSLRDRVAAYNPNDSIELTVRRGAETIKISVTLGERPDVDVDGYQFRVPGDGGILPFFGDPSNCLPRGEQG